jgi:hypothetical protein
MVVHFFNPVLGRLRQEDHKFKANVGYIGRPCLKKQNNKQVVSNLAPSAPSEVPSASSGFKGYK